MSHLENASIDPFSRAIDRLNPIRRVSYGADGAEFIESPTSRGIKVSQEILDQVSAAGAKSTIFTNRSPEWMRGKW